MSFARNLVLELAYQSRYGLPVWLIQTLTFCLPDIGPLVRLRGLLVSLFLPRMPKGFKLGRDVTLLAIDKLRLGNNIYLAKGCWLNAIGGLTLEDEVVFGPYVVISTSKHGFKDGSVMRGGAHPASVRIGRGTWIASHGSVTAGTTIGPGCLIASNCVVTKNTESNKIIGGVPGKVIGERTDNPSRINSRHDL